MIEATTDELLGYLDDVIEHAQRCDLLNYLPA